MRAIAIAATSAALLACGADGPSTPAPLTCEEVVGSRGECPSLAELCTGRCGGGHDCCYPMGDDWGDLITDCGPCPDAGAPGGCDLVVATIQECPSISELCTPARCGASGHDCCYPTADGWGDVITDCGPCPDAGTDAS